MRRKKKPHAGTKVQLKAKLRKMAESRKNTSEEHFKHKMLAAPLKAQEEAERKERHAKHLADCFANKSKKEAIAVQNGLLTSIPISPLEKSLILRKIMMKLKSKIPLEKHEKKRFKRFIKMSTDILTHIKSNPNSGNHPA